MLVISTNTLFNRALTRARSPDPPLACHTLMNRRYVFRPLLGERVFHNFSILRFSGRVCAGCEPPLQTCRHQHRSYSVRRKKNKKKTCQNRHRLLFYFIHIVSYRIASYRIVHIHLMCVFFRFCYFYSVRVCGVCVCLFFFSRRYWTFSAVRSSFIAFHCRFDIVRNRFVFKLCNIIIYIYISIYWTEYDQTMTTTAMLSAHRESISI